MVINEEAVRVAIDVNIYMILNRLMGPDCIYSRRPTHTTDVPDFNCHRAELLILAKENPKSPHHLVLVPAHGDNNSRTLRSHSKLTSSSSLSQQQTSGNQQSSSNAPVD
ncbi:hypothetical protein RhiirA5_408758 [Rhizophagus irregularis]|uniref:Uncharacterized protein n=1 Tax=Rhizophagus irregularis TaxID=588596 RepID=A0A2I1EUZ7_9GLOM|nr:hypothetical protein RhiirA5_408758 [Rhizophagus irregularis]PKY25953.1 hypothetical protein RhiirB3_441086 [Rhizophagus irregularis]